MDQKLADGRSGSAIRCHWRQIRILIRRSAARYSKLWSHYRWMTAFLTVDVPQLAYRCMLHILYMHMHILKLWHHIKNPTRQSMHVYMKNNCTKFHPNLIWNDWASDFLKSVTPTRTTTARSVEHGISSWSKKNKKHSEEYDLMTCHSVEILTGHRQKILS